MYPIELYIPTYCKVILNMLINNATLDEFYMILNKPYGLVRLVIVNSQSKFMYVLRIFGFFNCLLNILFYKKSLVYLFLV